MNTYTNCLKDFQLLDITRTTQYTHDEHVHSTRTTQYRKMRVIIHTKTGHETVGEETEDEADDGSDDDREDDERNEEEDDEMDEEESGGKERDEADECVDRKKSAVYLHLLSRPDCLSVYDDSHFSVLCRARTVHVRVVRVLCRARYVQQLKVLEAVCIRIHKPVLCKQKEHVVALKLYS